jgi:two-component system, chemotaxis family, protein-glutamate methylesterase/glutaminase
MATKLIQVLVMGGSAGALDALARILPHLTAGCAVPVAIVVHVAPTRSNGLAAVLRTTSGLPVQEAEDKEPLQAGKIYVAPPDYHLLIEREGTLALSSDAPVHYSRPAIDVLFESAADARGATVAGVLLSGASPDGAHGLAAIAEAGGVTIVQSPASARAPNMPEAALAMFSPDHVLPPEEIGPLLAQLLRSEPSGKEAR